MRVFLLFYTTPGKQKMMHAAYTHVRISAGQGRHSATHPYPLPPHASHPDSQSGPGDWIHRAQGL